MDALGAARMGDEIAHGAGILGMIAGAVIGAVVAVAVVAAVTATGGLAIVIFAGAIAGGALAANQILKGLKTIFDLPDPTTGVLASGSENVFTNSLPAARATLDFAAECSGGSFPFITHPYWPFPVTIAEGSKTVTINSMPAARITMLMTCSAFIKTASDNVFIGGPTARTEFVWDWTGWLETGFTWLGMAAMGGAAILAVMAGVAATATFAVVVGVTFAAFEGLGMLGDAIGPGYRDLFQGIAGMGLLLAGPKMARLQMAKVVAQRQQIARDFYTQAGMPEHRIDGHLAGIDFKKPVSVVELPSGTKLTQFQVPGGPQGSYYVETSTNATPGSLGISPQGVNRSTGEVVNKIPSFFETTQPTQGLQTQAASISDTWSVPGQAINTPGGATQYYIPPGDGVVPLNK